MNNLQIGVRGHAWPNAVQVPVLKGDLAVDLIRFGEVYGYGNVAGLQLCKLKCCDGFCHALWVRLQCRSSPMQVLPSCKVCD